MTTRPNDTVADSDKARTDLGTVAAVAETRRERRPDGFGRAQVMVLLRFIGLALGFFVGASLALLGAFGLFDGVPNGSKTFFGALLAAGLLVLTGTVASLVRWETRLRREEAALPPPKPRENPVLARWTVPPEEWRAFAESEKRRGGGEAVTVAGGVLAFGAFLCLFFGVPWLAGMGIAAVLAAFAGGMRWRAARADHAADHAAGRGEIVVRRDTVEINGHAQRFRDGRWWLGGARVVEDDGGMPVLEIVSRRTKVTREGTRRRVEDALRVPVPRGAEEEARRVAEVLRDPHRLPRADGGGEAREGGEDPA